MQFLATYFTIIVEAKLDDDKAELSQKKCLPFNH